jgi:LCP family protein required for cell wall assembly
MEDGGSDPWTSAQRPRQAEPGVPASSPQYGGGQGSGPAGGPVRHRRRRWPKVLIGLVVVLVIVIVGGYLTLDSRLQRENVLTDYAGRPADTPGTNWLIVGSDSRAGLSKQQRKEYATGNAAGRRTDSMMLMHTGSAGTTLVSLPRDSYVPIAGHGSNKLNAAFAFGGPQLLVRTVEQVTGVHIDHYAEIGFGGFVGVVDAVGGVRMCVKTPMKDPKAGLNLKKGCQVLNGGQALGYVRTRASARADLDRVDRQREFFSALIAKATSPGVLLNPFSSVPMALHATDNFSVDQHDGLSDLTRLMWSMKGVSSGDGITTTVPFGGFGSSAAAGSYLIWDHAKALKLFNAIKTDTKVPADVITH